VEGAAQELRKRGGGGRRRRSSRQMVKGLTGEWMKAMSSVWMRRERRRAVVGMKYWKLGERDRQMGCGGEIGEDGRSAGGVRRGGRGRRALFV